MWYGSWLCSLNSLWGRGRLLSNGWFLEEVCDFTLPHARERSRGTSSLEGALLVYSYHNTVILMTVIIVSGAGLGKVTPSWNDNKLRMILSSVKFPSYFSDQTHTFTEHVQVHAVCLYMSVHLSTTFLRDVLVHCMALEYCNLIGWNCPSVV